VVAVNETRPGTSMLDRAAGVVLAFEAVLLAVITVTYGAYAALNQGGERFLWGATIVCATFTAGIVAVVWGFWTKRRFAHGGAFATQLLVGAGGVWLIGTMPWLGAALIVGAVVVAIAVMRRLASLPRPHAED
jgi:hypothetical protein